MNSRFEARLTLARPSARSAALPETTARRRERRRERNRHDPPPLWSALAIAPACAVMAAGAVLAAAGHVGPVLLMCTAVLLVVGTVVSTKVQGFDAGLTLATVIIEFAITAVLFQHARHLVNTPGPHATSVYDLIASFLLLQGGALSFARWTSTKPYALVNASLLVVATAAAAPVGGLSNRMVLVWCVAAIAGLAAAPDQQLRRFASPVLPRSPAAVEPESLESNWVPIPRRSARSWSTSTSARLGALAIGALVLMPVAASVIPARGGLHWVDQLARDHDFGLPGNIQLLFDRQLDTSRRYGQSDEVMMNVRASAPDFWRAQTFDQWTGRVWHSTFETEWPLLSNDGAFAVPRGVGDGRASGREFIQTYSLERNLSGFLPGAGRIERVYVPQGVVVGQPDGTVTVDNLESGSVYTVVSRKPSVTADDLRQADPLRSPIPRDVAARYLQLPDVPPRVADLAASLGAEASSTYDRIRAMEQWLGANTEYTLDIPQLADGADTVEQYLFVDRRGYCVQIASTLAVMLRSVGVPTRLATGFVAGDRNDLSDTFVVRAKHAHAWVEVYFPGIGWQPFDPTASVPLSPTSTSPAHNAVRALKSMSWLFALAVGAGVLWVAGMLIGPDLAKAWRRIRRPRDATSWAGALQRRLEHEAARRGSTRQPGETVTEHVEALVNGALPDPRLREVAVLIDRATYAGVSIDGVEWMAAEGLLDEICAAHPTDEQPRAFARRSSRRSLDPDRPLVDELVDR